MFPFGVTIPATVPQRSEFPEGLMNYPVIPLLLVSALVHIVNYDMKPRMEVL
jgi:hypothetical protein